MEVLTAPKVDARKGHQIWVSILEEAEDLRLTQPLALETLLRLLILTAMLIGILGIAWTTENNLTLAFTIVMISVLLSQFAFIGHDAGHGTISRKTWINKFFGHYSMTFVAGMCFDAWFKTHKTHHQFCQNESKDPDMAVSLVVSLSPLSSRDKNRIGRFFTRHQHIHIWFMSLFFAHSQRHLTQVDSIKWRMKGDGAISLIHLCLWFALPCLLFDVSLSRAAIVYFIPLFVLGPHLAAIFWINHIGMPTIDNLKAFSFLEHQAVTSRTVRVPKGTAWLFGGLDLQIEHHILPQVPSSRLKKLQPIVAKHFHENGLEYRPDSWRVAIQHIAKHLYAISRSAA